MSNSINVEHLDKKRADEAKRFGLINDIFEPSELHKEVMNIAKRISSKSSYVIGLGNPFHLQPRDSNR